MNEAGDVALLDLLRLLERRGYAFVTPTPATHARVIGRPERQEARDLRDVLGWSLPFSRDLIDPVILGLLDAAGMIGADGGRLRSLVRVSTLHGRLYLHSAYPTDAEDAVFFGPDSYRFADLIAAELRGRSCPEARIVDIGAGAGVGGIVAASACPGASIVMTDVNPAALRLARINACAAGVAAHTVKAGDLMSISGEIDIAMANPPYIVDARGRSYRDGGGMHGGEISLDMARMAVTRLAPGGRLILYTGSAIVEGRDALHAALAGLTAEQGCTMRYREIDPDVFGEELEQPPYRDVERIAIIAAVIRRPVPS